MKQRWAWAAVVAIATIGGGAAACSGSDAGGAAPVDAGADVATPVDAAPVVDAGPDVEQDPNVYPAKHAPIPQLDNLGGPVLDHVKLVTVTFDSGPDGGPDPIAHLVEQFGDVIIKSDYWRQAMAGIPIGDGASNTHVRLPDTVSHKGLGQSDVEALVKNGVASGALPTPDNETLYAFYFPQSTTVSAGTLLGCPTFSVGFGGYHDSVPVAWDGGTAEVAYAVILQCKGASQAETVDGITRSASHEMAEAASDPFPSSRPAYTMASNDPWGALYAGDVRENGDLCIAAPNWDESGFAVQPLFSNAAAAASRYPCQPNSTKMPYFAAAVDTPVIDLGGRTSGGYLVVQKGGTAQTTVHVFSEAALPDDVHLYVGVSKTDAFGMGPSDPTDLAAPPPGISASLDRSTAHNGNAATLTVSVAKGASSGDALLVVRAVLDQAHWHDWPFAVHVR